MRGSQDFAAVSAAFKRMKNILEQAAEKGIVPVTGTNGIAMAPALAALEHAAEKARVRVAELRKKGEYVALLEAIAKLRPQIDKFFDEVMVMDPNPAVRDENLKLLGLIVSDFRQIADISEIVAQG